MKTNVIFLSESRILLLATFSVLLVMQGCSIAPTGKAKPDPMVVTPEPSPSVEIAPPIPVETVIETKPEPVQQQTSHCVFHPNKGIAEVEKVEEGQWTMRFYPGDIAFVHHSENLETQPGEEFRALRYSRTSGPCDEDYFELLGAFN